METNRRYVVTAAMVLGVVVLIGIGIVQTLSSSRETVRQESTAPAPVQATSTIPVAEQEKAPLSTKVAVEQKTPVIAPPSIASGDSITSWDYTGAYANNDEAKIRAQTEIARLTGLLGTGEHSDTTLYVGIANQYGLLGDGKRQYDYLVRAIAVGKNANGLPWHNLGVLMERLGAVRTARVAYSNAALIHPDFKFYQLAYLTFLVGHIKGETESIEKAFSVALTGLGSDAEIVALREKWRQL